MTVPLVITPSCVYSGEFGFFLTPMMGSWNLSARARRRPAPRPPRPLGRVLVSCLARDDGAHRQPHARGLELGVRHVRLLEAQAHGADEALELGRLHGARAPRGEGGGQQQHDLAGAPGQPSAGRAAAGAGGEGPKTHLARETVANKRDLGDHALPLLGCFPWWRNHVRAKNVRAKT